MRQIYTSSQGVFNQIMFFIQSSFFQKYPKGFLAIFLTQIFFNFGFFGLKSLFVLYILEHLSIKESEAFELFATLMALSYAMSLLGGFLADKVIGAKNSLLIGGIVNIMGISLLAFPSNDVAFLGMALLSLGSGCFKPTFSTLLSLLFKDPQDPRKDSAFTNLYIAMNLGSFMGPLLCSIVSLHYGWIGGLMTVILSFMVGIYLFFRQTQHLTIGVKTNTIFRPLQAGAILILSVAITYFLFKYRSYFHGLMGGIVLISFFCFCTLLYKSTAEERAGLLKTIPYIFLFAFFCSLFEQSGSSLMLFFDRQVDRHMIGMTLPSSSLLSLNPILILMLGMFFPSLSKNFLEKKGPLDGLTKFAIGFFFISLSFGVLAFGSSKAQDLVSLHWVLISLLLQAIGELFIVPVGFANISKLAPTRYLGLMMSIWLMAIAYGHYFAGIFARLLFSSTEGVVENNLESYYHFFFKLSCMPFIVALLLMLNILRKYHKRIKWKLA